MLTSFGVPTHSPTLFSGTHTPFPSLLGCDRPPSARLPFPNCFTEASIDAVVEKLSVTVLAEAAAIEDADLPLRLTAGVTVARS